MGKIMYLRKGSIHIAPYKKFIITFVMNDGTSDSITFETNREGKVQELPEVLRDGYSFDGWFTAASGGTQVSSNTVFTADTVVYAQWSLLAVTVTITGTGNTTYCYATIGGTKRYGAGTYEVVPGDTITFGVYGYSSTYYGRVTIDGTQALNVTGRTTQTYNWTVPSGVKAISIAMTYNSSYSQRNGRIEVTTEKLPASGGSGGNSGSTSSTATITVTGSGGSYCYLTMPDGEKVTSAGTYDVQIGSVIQCYVSSGTGCQIYLNNNTVASGSIQTNVFDASYSYKVTKKATIDLYQQNTSGSGSARIRITEG